MQTQHILGLDIGANSIGWAAVECRPGTLLPVRLMDLNSHIFQEAMDNKKNVPFNAHRREKRLMRRQIARSASRRRGLVGMLQGAGFLPSVWDAAAANKVDREFAERILRDPKAKPFVGDADEKTLASPFAMRAYALEHSLTPHEFGRVILHLHRRRGFRSNRGAKYLDLLRHPDLGRGVIKSASEEKQDAAEKSEADKERRKEEKKVLGGIQHLCAEMKKRGSRTVGGHVWKSAEESGNAPARITTDSAHFVEKPGKDADGIERVGLYANREKTEEEFAAVCNAQMKFGLAGLDEKTRDKICAAVFEQLPVQNPPPPSRRLRHLRYNTVGVCSLEPGRRRADKAALVSQEFRTWAVINNIVLEGEDLSAEQRQKLFGACQDPAQLDSQGRLTWAAAAKILGVKSREVNYVRDEDDAKTGIMGNRTLQKISGELDDNARKRLAEDAGNLHCLVEDLLTIKNKLHLYNRLVRRWKFSPGLGGVAFRLATLDLESGHMKYSRRAMARMLPHLKSGMSEHDAQKAVEYPDRSATAKPRKTDGELLPLAAIPETGNPRVQRAMFAVRRIVNAAALKWGAPAAIRVEMPRDMKAAKKHRAEIEQTQKRNRENNLKAETALIQYAQTQNGYDLDPVRPGLFRVSADDREKYKMWEFEQEGKCPYCGKSISREELLSEAAQVDHILPQSVFRQSHMNTVVACRDCNQKKGNRTPWEAWGKSDPDRWERIAKRAHPKKAEMSRLPREKRRRILNKKHNPLDDEEFCNRALQDTQHIAALVHQFLSKTGIKVQVSRGQATAILRREWGLVNVLPRHPEDKSAVKDDVLRYDPERAKLAKNRRDHRHHAVDAFVVALTDHSLLMRLVKHCQERETAAARPKKFTPPESWEGDLRQDAENRLREKIVSHRKTGKVRGALHRDTIHGRGFYVEKFPWPASAAEWEKIVSRKEMKGFSLDREPGLNGDADDGDVCWIQDGRIRSALAEWLEAQHNPPPKGISEIPVARRYYFYRCKVEDALKHAESKWHPGSGGKSGWIVDKGIHDILNKWLRSHKTGIKQALADDPPKTPARKGRRGNVINTVRIGFIKSGVKTLRPKARKNRPAPPPRSVELRSNHHLEIFRKGGERKLRMVPMLEAARRKQRREPTVNRDSEWGEDWDFQCSLAQGDLVVFNRDEVDERIRSILDAHEKQFHSLVYRVQKMSFTDSGLKVAFRHHSVSGTNDKDEYGFIMVSSPKDLAVRKKEVGALGADYSALER